MNVHVSRHGRRHNGRISGDKKPPSSPMMEPEGGHASSFVAILVAYRDKKAPSSPVMEPESGPAGRQIRDSPRRVFATVICSAGTQIGARTQHRAVMSETQNRQETPYDALPARNKLAGCSARNRSFLSPFAPIILEFGAICGISDFGGEMKSPLVPS